MGIKINTRGVSSIIYNGGAFSTVYVNKLKIWPDNNIIISGLSCYYNGYWIDEYPWTDDTPWTD